MKSKIFIFIFLALMIVLCIVTRIQVNKTIEASQKTNCMIDNLQGIIDMTDLQQLCTSDNCIYYFNQRITYFEDAVNKCGLGEIYVKQEDPKEDVYINIDDLNKSDPTIYVRNGSEFVEDGN